VTSSLPQEATGVAALYCLFGDTSWLTQSYLSIYPCVERIMFFLSSSPWYGQQRASEVDLTMLQALPDPAGKIEIMSGDWASETEQRNITLAYAQHKGFTHGLIIDADEVYEGSELLQGIALARSQPQVTVWHVQWYTYWKSPEYRIEPVEPYQPPVFVTLGNVGFAETRNALGDTHALIPPEVCMCHHLSYALSDEALRAKHIMQPGHSQSAYPGWYEHKWKRWDADPSIENLHPVHAEWFKRAVRQPNEVKPGILRGLTDVSAR
jgi:hypothetical protein